MCRGCLVKEVGQEERTLGGDGEIVAWGRVNDLLEDSRFKVVEHDLAPGLCLQGHVSVPFLYP